MGRGAGGFFDIFAYHRYTAGISGDLYYPHTDDVLVKVVSLLKKHRAPIEIWETESGMLMPSTAYAYHRAPSNMLPVSVVDGPRYFVRNMAHLLGAGVKKWFYFTASTTRRVDHRFSNGLFEWDGSPKPMAVAYAVMANLIQDAEHISSQNVKGVVKHVFRDHNKKITIAWCDVGEARLPVAGANSSVLDVLGRGVNTDNGAIVVGSDPIYLISTE